MPQLALSPAVTPTNLATDHAMNMFMLDIARAIYPPDEIAARWGFDKVPRMRSWLASHPEVIRQIESIRAINNADQSVLDRVAHKAAHSVEASIPTIHEVVSNPHTPAREKIAGAALLGRWAGSDAHAQPKQGDGGSGGAKLNVVFQFANAPTQTISTTVVEIEGGPVSPPKSPSNDGVLRAIEAEDSSEYDLLDEDA